MNKYFKPDLLCHIIEVLSIKRTVCFFQRADPDHRWCGGRSDTAAYGGSSLPEVPQQGGCLLPVTDEKSRGKNGSKHLATGAVVMTTCIKAYRFLGYSHRYVDGSQWLLCTLTGACMMILKGNSCLGWIADIRVGWIAILSEREKS